jgi:uncharacterized cofD-like protein
VLRIVGIGGGTGLPLLMSGLSRLEDRCAGAGGLCLTALVCVSDNGGSSGRLRETFHVPALGDIRNCLVGLSRPGSVLAELFQYRFPAGKDLAGHALGNLILTALYQQAGSLRKAIDLLSDSLQLCGSVLPATETSVTLCAQGRGGRLAKGECEIARARMPIERVWLEPESPAPARGVLDSLDAADAIVLGPGSLFTSVIPPLLVSGVADAIRRSKAVRIYVCNLMAEPGETDGFSAADHVRALAQYLGPHALDMCVLNTRVPVPRLAKRYIAAGAQPIAPEVEAIKALGVLPITADLLAQEGPKARHDAVALGQVILELAHARVARNMRRTVPPEPKVEPKVVELCAESSVT